MKGVAPRAAARGGVRRLVGSGHRERAGFLLPVRWVLFRRPEWWGSAVGNFFSRLVLTWNVGCGMRCKSKKHDPYMKTRMSYLSMALAAAMLAGGSAYADGPEPHKNVLRAANFGEEQLKQVLAGGVAVDVTDEDGETALMEAADKGNLPAVQLLLKYGAQVNRKDEDGKTALMYAADEGRTPVVQALLAAGANPDVKDKDGETALMKAEEERHADTAALLRNSNKSAPTATSAVLVGKQGMKAVLRAAYEGESALSQLLAGGTSVDCADRDGETALMEAADKGNLAAVQLLLKCGAKVNQQDHEGKTALMDAASDGHTEVVRALIAAGADLNARDEDGETALMKALEDRHNDTAEALRAAGAH